jgi:hypothetical protein
MVGLAVLSWTADAGVKTAAPVPGREAGVSEDRPTTAP